MLLLECGISCGAIRAQEMPIFFLDAGWMQFDGVEEREDGSVWKHTIYKPTAEKFSLIHFVEDDYAKITGSFFSDVYDHSSIFDPIYGAHRRDWNNTFGGVPFAVKAAKGDIVTMTFDFSNVEDMMYVQEKTTKKRKLYISRASVFDSFYTWIDTGGGADIDPDSVETWMDEKLYFDPSYNSVAVRQIVDGTVYPFIRSFYKQDSANVDPNYTIVVRKIGKIASIKFDVDPQASFDLTDPDGLLVYNLLRYVRVSAVDTYGKDSPILNSIVTQWNVDKETGIARFTPVLYPFSFVIDGYDDSYETNSANKSASSEDDEQLNTGIALSNCMTLEATDPDILLLDLNKATLTRKSEVVDAVSDESKAWYDITGRRLQSKPTMPGVYIHNGKKTVVKQ
ncbi:MAG: hypothetical protein ACI35Q_10380 [Marinilabiliaceae bacterium]